MKEIRIESLDNLTNIQVVDVDVDTEQSIYSAEFVDSEGTHWQTHFTSKSKSEFPQTLKFEKIVPLHSSKRIKNYITRIPQNLSEFLKYIDNPTKTKSFIESNFPEIIAFTTSEDGGTSGFYVYYSNLNEYAKHNELICGAARTFDYNHVFKVEYPYFPSGTDFFEKSTISVLTYKESKHTLVIRETLTKDDFSLLNQLSSQLPRP